MKTILHNLYNLHFALYRDYWFFFLNIPNKSFHYYLSIVKYTKLIDNENLYILHNRKDGKSCISHLIPAGFEPATVRLEGECSIQLSYETELTSF